MKQTLTPFTATMIAEGQWELAGEEPDETREIEAWQYLEDTGLGYQLQGWFGRRLRDLKEAGLVHERSKHDAEHTA